MLLNPAQQENPAIRRQPAAVERDRHLLAANGWQCEGEKVIFVHDGCGVPRSLAEPALATESCDKSRLSATSVTQNRSSRCIRRANNTGALVADSAGSLYGILDRGGQIVSYRSSDDGTSWGKPLVLAGR